MPTNAGCRGQRPVTSSPSSLPHPCYLPQSQCRTSVECNSWCSYECASPCVWLRPLWPIRSSWSTSTRDVELRRWGWFCITRRLNTKTFEFNGTSGRNFSQVREILWITILIRLLEATPFGKLPLLEWNGVRLPQSLACTRFLALKLAPELLGKDDWEEVWCNIAADYLQDFYIDDDGQSSNWFTKHEETVMTLLKRTEEYFTNIEKVFLSNGKKYLVSDRVSLFLLFVISLNAFLADLGRFVHLCEPWAHVQSLNSHI